MRILKCFWAGYLVAIYTGVNLQEQKEKLAELEHEIKTGVMKYSVNGSTFVLTELCVDIIEDNKLVAMHNFKR